MSGAHLHLVAFLAVVGSGTATEPVPILPHKTEEWTVNTSDLPGIQRNVTHSPAVSSYCQSGALTLFQLIIRLNLSG